MELSTKEIRLYPHSYLKAILRHMGPEFWIVATFPYYISWVWGSGEIFPGLAWLEDNPTQAGSYLATFAAYMGQTWRFWLGAIVIGPVLGGATVLYDDYFDRELDRLNPRKNSYPFHKAPFRSDVILNSSLFLFALSLFLAVVISTAFFVIIAPLALMSILYSAPPVRLKARGGWDLATNMLGFGVLCSLGGFILSAPISDYPWAWLSVMILGTGTLYILTTIVDMEADSLGRVPTIAVKLGMVKALDLAIVLLMGANAIILSMSLAGYLFSPGVALWVWPISVAEFIPLLHLRQTRDKDKSLWTIFAVGSLMAIGTFLLALNHVGIWNV